MASSIDSRSMKVRRWALAYAPTHPATSGTRRGKDAACNTSKATVGQRECRSSSRERQSSNAVSNV